MTALCRQEEKSGSFNNDGSLLINQNIHVEFPSKVRFPLFQFKEHQSMGHITDFMGMLIK